MTQNMHVDIAYEGCPERERELSYPPIMPRVRVGTALSRARRYCGTLRICVRDSSDLDSS
jgi:hypothetical protein